MCWELLKVPTRRKASDDITCYKTLCPQSSKYGGSLLSYVRGFTYHFGKVNPKVDITFKHAVEGDYYESKTGYYSYKIKPCKLPRFSILVECTIPKDTFYYENDGEYISETIIINKILS